MLRWPFADPASVRPPGLPSSVRFLQCLYQALLSAQQVTMVVSAIHQPGENLHVIHGLN